MSTHVEWIDAHHPFFSVSLRTQGEAWNGDNENADDADCVPHELGIAFAAMARARVR